MRSGQTSNPPGQHRVISFRIVVAALVVTISLAWLAKGSGVKTWVVTNVLHRPGNSHVNTVMTLSDRVRLASDPMVQFERVALPATAGVTFTCVRVGPDSR